MACPFAYNLLLLSAEVNCEQRCLKHHNQCQEGYDYLQHSHLVLYRHLVQWALMNYFLMKIFGKFYYLTICLNYTIALHFIEFLDILTISFYQQATNNYSYEYLFNVRSSNQNNISPMVKCHYIPLAEMSIFYWPLVRIYSDSQRYLFCNAIFNSKPPSGSRNFKVVRWTIRKNQLVYLFACAYSSSVVLLAPFQF